MVDDISWLADGNTLLGKLQRGRGAGFLEALQEARSRVESLILDCIRNDYRLDRQCEDRGEFNAALVLAMGIDMSWALEHLHRVEAISSDCNASDVTIDTLCELARRGHIQSTRLLRDYATWGKSWFSAVEALWVGHGPVAVEGLDDVIKVALLDEEKAERLSYLDNGLLGYFAGTDERMNEIIVSSQRRNREQIDRERDRDQLVARLSDTCTTVVALLDMVDKDNQYVITRILERQVTADDVPLLIAIASSDDGPRKYVAIRALGYTGAPEAFHFLWGIATNNPELVGPLRGSAVRAVGHFPSWISLSAARESFESANPFLRAAAEEILEACGSENDIPAALKAIRDGMRDSDVYRTYAGLEILAAIEEPVQDDILDEVFAWSPSQFGRNRAADAIEAVAIDHFRHDYAKECLWDCSVFTREVGCRHADIGDPATLERIRIIASDPLEYEDTRISARKRLGMSLDPNQPHPEKPH